MDVQNEEKLRVDFRNLLFDLSKSQDALQDSGKKKRSNFYQELERLYWDEKFQHYSSDIFVVLKNLQSDSVEGSIDVLGQNLDLIRQGYQQKNIASDGKSKDIQAHIRKLYDDVNLLSSLVLTDEAENWRYSQENRLKQQEQRLKQLDESINKSQSKLERVEKKIKSSQKEYIAILGIFAAIILAFTGGITFSTSVLENMHKSSIYRVVLVILLIGFTLVNILYLLFMFIDKLVRNDKRIIPIKPVITFDIAVIAFVIILIVLWTNGTVELRNRNINEHIFENESHSSEIIDTSEIDDSFYVQSLDSESIVAE